MIIRISLEAQKQTLTDLAKFLAQSCYHIHPVMDINMEAPKEYLKSCLRLPEIGGKVQFLIDNLRMPL